MEPLRALLADAVISFKPRFGDGGANRFGCGRLDTNCDVISNAQRQWVWRLTFSPPSMMVSSVSVGRLRSQKRSSGKLL